jgi:hypothetical protein
MLRRLFAVAVAGSPAEPHIPAMIVYRPMTKPRQRPKAQSKPAATTCPVVVTRKRGRYRDRPASPRDPEVEASIVAFFAGMGLTWKPADQS